MVMSRQTVSKTVAVLGRSIIALGFVLCALQSCGSSSSSDTTAVCNQFCNREVSCTEADGGPSSAAAMAQCTSSCAAQKCTNDSELVSAANTCLAKSSCTAFVACAATEPQCQMSTSGSGGTGAATGGTNGGGAGTTGSGGTTGTGSCADCDKAAACCAAIATMAGLSSSAAGCDAYSTSMCNTSGQDQSLEAQACTALLQAGAAENIAACK
jgi:hypothetical protein